VLILEDHRRAVSLHCLAFSPDGVLLAAGGDEGVVQVWDAAAGQLRHRFGMVAGVHAVAFLAPASLLAAAWNVYAWDLGGAAWPGQRRELEPTGYYSSAAALSPDRATLAVSYYANEDGCWFGAFRLPENERRWQTKAVGGYGSMPVAFAFGPDGKTVYAGVPSGSVRAYDAATGSGRGEVGRFADGLEAIAVSPDGRRLACAAGTHLHLLALDPPAEIAHHVLGPTPFLAVAFHPSGDFFATANGDGKVDYWDARTGAHRQAFDWGVGKLNGVAFDANGDRAACCGEAGKVVVWDVDR
jgi:WD40 repeat protein